MGRDARGIDLVAGAKGSPMQLILSAVFHLDAPTGNIPLAAAKQLAQNRAVKKAIPLALGDSFRGFRIVGTTHDYVAHYGGEPAAGRLWREPMEAVLGAEAARATGLAVGGEFIGSHGIAEGGEEHGERPYKVVGVLKPTGTVLDRLVLCSIESVWFVHVHPGKHEDPKEVLAALREDEQEITALLVQYASPIAAATLPRFVNATSTLQAASPAYESARLFRMIGVGVEVLRAFALVLLAAAGLSIFIALYNAMEERRYDLAIMRMLGASPGKLMRLVLLEAVALALVGAALGLVARPSRRRGGGRDACGRAARPDHRRDLARRPSSGSLRSPPASGSSPGSSPRGAPTAPTSPTPSPRARRFDETRLGSSSPRCSPRRPRSRRRRSPRPTR